MGRDRADSPTPRQTPVVVTFGRPKTPPVNPEQKRLLQEEWDALEERRQAIARMEQELSQRWPEDLSRPISVGAVPHAVPLQPSWAAFLANGPLPVKPTTGTLLTAVGMLVAALTTVIVLVTEGRHHLNDNTRHLDQNSGLGWGGKVQYESKDEARTAHTEIETRLEKKLDSTHERLGGELIKVLGGPAKYERWKQTKAAEKEAKVPASVMPPLPPG
jgi:hypothetical protein